MDVEALSQRAVVHAALADPHRLAIVDELAWSDRSPSSLGAALGLGSNLLAHHLSILEGAGVVERLTSSGDGRRRYVRVVPNAVASIVGPSPRAIAARHVLFVCTANSARSQLAAAVWNAQHEVPASSAGTRPAPNVRLEAIQAANRVGLDLHAARTRSIAQVTERPDLVISVCDIAHEELLELPADATILHWSVEDPAVEGTPAAFDMALRSVTTRIGTLAPHVHPRRARRTTHP